MTEANASNDLDEVIQKLSGEMAERVIFSIPDMIFIVDRNMKIRRVLNSDPAKLSAPVETLYGLSIVAVVDDVCKEPIQRGMERALASDQVQEVEYTISFGGETHYYEGRFKRIQEGLIACFERNITERKLHEKRLVAAKREVEKIQKINQLVLDNANSGLMLLSPDYVVQWQNLDKYFKDSKYARYKTGSTCYKEMHGTLAPCADCAAKRAFETKKITEAEFVVDQDMTLAITASPVLGYDDTVTGMVIKFDDITIRRKAEEQLKKAKEVAEASDKLKSLFLSNMSHEIRTPLNAIVGFSDLLMYTEDQEQRQEYISIIRRNNELLLQLINDIIDLSKIESNTLEFIYSEVEVNSLFRNIELGYRQKMQVRPELTFTFVPPLEECVIFTEENRLQQVLNNYINNALKFTEAGEISMGYEVLEEGVRFYVSDTGKGIPEDKLQEVFKRFCKLDTFTNGTGLGLSICETIIRKLEGTIGVDSELGKGSTFWFTLPLQPIRKKESVCFSSNTTAMKPQAADQPITGKSPEKNKPVLLIAEDEKDNFFLYETLLSRHYEIHHAWDGEEVVDLFRRYQDEIDVVIMDVKMPKIDGLEALKRVRAIRTDIPVIAASAYAFNEDVARIKEAGFDGYVSKPLSREALFAAVEEQRR